MAAQSALGATRHLQTWGGAAALEELMGGLAAGPRVGNQSLHAWTYSAVFSGIRHSIMSQPRGNTRNESRQVI